MRKELSFLIPVMVDGNFQKCQIFTTSRSLSDLIGKIFSLQLKAIKKYVLAAWLGKELKKFGSEVVVLKLNGDNSHSEKERVTQRFKEG